MSEETTALAESKGRNTPKQLEKHLWQPGQSGNPGGRPKGTTIRELKAAARGNLPLAIEVLAGLLRSEDERMRFDAVQFAYLYGFGKPMEGRDIVHLDSMAARHQELVAVPVETPSLPSPTVAEAPVAEEAPEIAPPPVLTAPEPPVVAAGVPPNVSVPTGLKCIYRGKDGKQCAEVAAEGASWCQPHKVKLFGTLEAP